MKTISKWFVAAAVIPLIVSSVSAQTQTLVPLSSDGIPTTGIFESIANKFPPLPYDPFPELSLYTDGTPGYYWFDDRGFTLQDLATLSALSAHSGGGGRAMDDAGGSSGGGYASNSYSFDTNGLWLELTGITNGIANLNLHNGTNQVYAIWGTTNLPGGWTVQTEVWPTNASVMPFLVETFGQQPLFMKAEDWTGVREGTNTTPSWWFWEYFGTTALSDTNLDSQNNTLLSDYQNGIDPNIISFSPSVTNQYANNVNLPIALAINAGYPFYVAVSVDDPNYMADANWQPYAGPDITAYLGSVEGWHTVWIGLRGFASDSTQTWQSLPANLDLTPPILTIINPTANVTTLPIIELQGSSDRPIGQVNFDIQNASGTVSNLGGTVTGQMIDTNTLHFTSNTFQCYDIPLTNGLNTITLRVTDLAGNMATTNIAVTLDFTGATNPPAMTLFWPLNGDTVSGTEFTLRGSLDNFTASLTAQIVDTNGDTTNISGLVERNGLFWVENVPLAVGTNYITLTAVDAAGNISVTNLVVNNSNAAVTIDDFSGELGGDPRNVLSVVSGTCDLTNVTLWVNSVQATQSGTNWAAYNIPVSPGGTAVVEARAIPNSENGGNGTGTTQPSDGTPVNPIAAGSVAAQTQLDQPVGYSLQKYQSKTVWTTEGVTNYGMVNYVYGEAGMESDIQGHDSIVCSWSCDPFMSDSCLTTEIDSIGDGGRDIIEYIYPGLDSFTTYECQDGIPYTYLYGNRLFPKDVFAAGALPNLKVNVNEHYGNYAETQSISTQMTLQTGGKGIVSQQNLYEIDFSATNYIATQLGNSTPTWQAVAAPAGQITVAGQTLGASSQTYTVLPNNVSMDITPQSSSPAFSYTATPVGPELVPITLSVASSAAAQISSNNDWGVVETNDYVIISASCSNPLLLTNLTWSEGSPVLGNHELPPWQVYIPISSPIEHKITATYKGTQNKGSLNLWVIWADLNINISGTLDPNDKADALVNSNTWPTPTVYNIQLNGGNGLGGGNALGAIDCVNNTELDYAFTIGRMEATAVLKPPGIANLITNWTMTRTRVAIAWDNAGMPSFSDPTNGIGETSAPSFQYLNQSVGNMYDLDVPGCSIDLPGTLIRHTAEVYDNFYEYVKINLGNADQVCSTTNTWSYTAQVDVDATVKVHTNFLSLSPISPLPTNSIYNPPR